MKHLILVTAMLLGAPLQANDDAVQTIAALSAEETDSSISGEPSSPFYLTTFSEIQDLPENDQKRYLDEVKKIASDFPKEIIANRSSNECQKDQLLCEPPLFGSNTCVAATDFSFNTCKEKSTEKKIALFFREPSSESSWEDFLKKVSAFCDNAANTDKCKKLEDLRIELFMNRRSH